MTMKLNEIPHHNATSANKLGSGSNQLKCYSVLFISSLKRGFVFLSSFSEVTVNAWMSASAILPTRLIFEDTTYLYQSFCIRSGQVVCQDNRDDSLVHGSWLWIESDSAMWEHFGQWCSFTYPCVAQCAEHDYNGLSYGGSLWTVVLLYLSLRRRQVVVRKRKSVYTSITETVTVE